jgi:hypothetical protein
MVGSPVQLPVDADSFCPCWTVPLTVGGDVFTGATAFEPAEDVPTTMPPVATPRPSATTADAANRFTPITHPIPPLRDPGGVRRA